MNKLLNNLLGMYKQAKLKKSAMIIDEILDRKDGASYNPQDFYDYVSQQLDVLNSKDIATALDSGTEEDVKKALCEYIKLGEYNPAICDYINSVNWLEEEDVEKWFSIKLSDEQAKEFAKLLTENNIKNKSKKEGEEIRVSFFLLPSSIGVAQGLLAATLSKFPDKQASTIKKAEEDLIEVGWGLYTNDEYEIKDNALYGDDKPQEVNETFWNKINNEIDKVESWFLKEGYKKFFTKVRDEGHGKDSELGGTAWMTENQLKDFMANAEQWDTEFVLAESSGTLDFGNIPVDYNEALSFKLKIYVDDKDLDELGIESKRVSKNKKFSSKAKDMRKKSETFDGAEEFAKKIIEDNKYSFSGHTDMAKLENNAYSMFLMDNASIKEILDDAKKIVSELDKDKDKKLEDADLYFGMKDRALLAEKVLEEKTKQEKQSSKTKAVKKDARTITEKDISETLTLEKEPYDRALNELSQYYSEEAKGVPNGSKEMYELNKKYTDLRERLKKKYKIKATKKQAEKVLTLKEAIGKDESEFKNMEDIVDYMNHLPLNANKSSWTVEGFGGNSIDVENLSNGEKATIKLKKNFNSRYATRQKKLFKSATIKHENGVYNVYSESGKCLGKGYKTKEEAEKRLKQVEYFKNKKAVTGTDYWGPKEIPDEEEEGTFIIRYYGGPGHIDYLRKSRNGKYHWVEQTHFDYINDKPFETTDYELVKKLVDQFGGKPEKIGTNQTNNKKKSLKDIVISKMAKIKK